MKQIRRSNGADMRVLIALTGHEIDRDIAAAAARTLDPARDQILAVHVVHPREVEATVIRGSGHRPVFGDGSLPVSRGVTDPALVEDAGQAFQRVEDEMRAHVEDLKRQALDDFTVDFDVIIDGDPADAIVAAVEDQGISSIVMGTRSKRSRFTSALLGSCAEDVIRRTSAPVLIVKEGAVAAGES